MILDCIPPQLITIPYTTWLSWVLCFTCMWVTPETGTRSKDSFWSTVIRAFSAVNPTLHLASCQQTHNLSSSIRRERAVWDGFESKKRHSQGNASTYHVHISTCNSYCFSQI